MDYLNVKSTRSAWCRKGARVSARGRKWPEVVNIQAATVTKVMAAGSAQRVMYRAQARDDYNVDEPAGCELLLNNGGCCVWWRAARLLEHCFAPRRSRPPAVENHLGDRRRRGINCEGNLHPLLRARCSPMVANQPRLTNPRRAAGMAVQRSDGQGRTAMADCDWNPADAHVWLALVVTMVAAVDGEKKEGGNRQCRLAARAVSFSFVRRLPRWEERL